VLRIVESLGWVFGYILGGELQFGRGEVGWERRRKRNRGRECRQMGASNGFFRRNHRRNTSVGDSVGESATSLYGYLSLNPSVISVGKISWRHHAIAYFQMSCITRRRNRRYRPTEIFCWYIPTVSPTDLFRRYIPTDFETELFSSVYITDGKIQSVIPLLFSGFPVVIWSWRFESLGESVGISIGESATSPYGANVLHPSVIPSVKIPPITSTSANHLFFLILNISSVISSVYTDGCWPSVVTDKITDGVKSVGNGDPKLSTELFCH